MPLIYESSYTKRPLLYFNSYLETLIPYLTTKVHQINYERERLELDDGDFLDLDWIKSGAKKLMLITHGFEGNTRDVCMEKSASYFSKQGYDVLLWNLRSCSEELNRLPRFYHHGAIDDLDAVIKHGSASKDYREIYLVGYSLGGAILINYLGSDLHRPRGIVGSVAISVPLDIQSVPQKIGKGLSKFIIEKNFLEKVKKKILKKALQFPKQIDADKVKKCASLTELHDEVVVKLNGFESSEEYFDRWSCSQTLKQIDSPLLLINAKNDPLLSENDFPYDLCKDNEFVYLETPKYGGHVGFSRKEDGELWYLKRIDEFIKEDIMESVL